MIVEDNLLNHFLLESFLKEENVTIVSAHNGQEAVNIIDEDNTIDIVLLDINMPIMNGYEAIKQIKQINKHIPVIAQTGYGMEEDIQNIKEAGFDNYLIKPIEQQRLIDMLSKYQPK